MSEISDRIAEDALKPQSVSNDGVSVVRRSIADQIAADRYARDLATASSTPAALFRGMNSKFVPPGGH